MADRDRGRRLMRCLIPASLPEALNAVATSTARPVAGGLDVMRTRPARREAGHDLLRIGHLDELRTIAWTDDGSVSMGAATRYVQLESVPGLPDALIQALRELGGPQIRAQGTVGGAICSASASTDIVVALLACDAHVTTSRPGEDTETALQRLLDVLAAGDPGDRPLDATLLTRVAVGAHTSDITGYGRLTRRGGTTSAAVSCAVRIGDKLNRTRVVVGGVDFPHRLPSVERTIDDGADDDTRRARALVLDAAHHDLADIPDGTDRELAARFVARVVSGTRGPRDEPGDTHGH